MTNPMDLGMAEADFERLTRLGQVLVLRERRGTGYVAGPGEGARKCISCVRKRYGGPSCCDEGWERYRAAMRHESGDPGGCTNWIGWDVLAGPDPRETVK